MNELTGTRVYDKVNRCEATIVAVESQCGSAVLRLEDEKGRWAQWPRNVEEVEETPDYDPDCPACLRHRRHSEAEHMAALRRVYEASRP